MRTAPRDALLAAHAGKNSGAVFGLHRSMDTLGAVVGPLVAVAILYFLPNKYEYVFYAAAIPSVFAIYFAMIVKDPPKAEVENKKAKYSFKEFWKLAPAEYKFILFLLTTFAFVNSSDVFLILKSGKDTGSGTLAVLAYVLYNVVYAFSSYPAGIVADKVGKKNVYVLGLVIFSAVYFGFAFNNSSVFVWILFAVYGFYTAFTEGTSKAWISDLIEERFVATAIGLFTMSSGFAIMLGSLFAGILWDAFGPKVPFLISAIVSLVVALLLATKKHNR
jgi:MFS family permease